MNVYTYIENTELKILKFPNMCDEWLDFICECSIINGNFDNVNSCNFEIPSYWDIGKVYERLIEDVSDENNVINVLMEVFTSFIDEHISDFNYAVYYQSRQYIFESYNNKQLL